MDDIAAMLGSESAKLAGLLDAAHPGISVRETVELYYQVINVSSMVSMLRQRPGGSGLSEGLDAADSHISRFNAEVHPAISGRLDEEISRMRTALESGGQGSYDDLRKMMSTREFVAQYEKGLA